MPPAKPPRACKDCVAEVGAKAYKTRRDGTAAPVRDAPYAGPRCTTHWRTERRRRAGAAHDNRVQQVYGLRPGEYEALYQAQGGKCPICQRATGRTRRLSVDHDHATNLVRGLLCRPCNTLLGQARDAVGFFERAISYLNNPTARQLDMERFYQK